MQGSSPVLTPLPPVRRWTIQPTNVAAAELAEKLKVAPILAQLLLGRGLTEPESCREFLLPSLKLLHDPSTLGGIGAAANRTAQAIRNKQKIVIYGDYDVDGITATAILWHAIRLLGGDVGYYIPHRIEEGYGLSPQSVAQVIDQGAKLIITVDCGVTAVEAAQVAGEHGVDLIITDHHQWREDKLPDCCAIVHPKLPVAGQAEYANPYLCGAGVAFKLAWQIALALTGNPRVSPEFRAFLIEATALAALGTIADVVPLVGENRILAHYGLSGLRTSKLIGIKALIASAALTGQNLDSYHVGFCLAPRLNACGRMGHAALAVKMLTEASETEAIDIAIYLEQQNRARQAMEKNILAEALAQLEEGNFSAENDRAIVLGSESWHPGVIGIVAARLVDRLNRPAIMIALAEGHGQGSGRSVPGFHLAKALAACGSHLVAHGGHEMAAGLKVRRENFDAFREAFREYARLNVRPEMMRAELNLEAAPNLNEMSEALVNDIRRLGPFGHGNRKPLFCFRDIQVAAAPKIVGKAGEHLQFLIKQGTTRMKCIAFRQAAMAEQLKPGTAIELAAEPTVNAFNGYRNVELEVKDLRIM